jgi:hypothetical protein
LDCRISTYLSKLEIPQTIDLIMIDLDLSNFGFNMQTLDLAKRQILTKLQNLCGLPKERKVSLASVIWSGNGNHLLVPVESNGDILEQMSDFDIYKDPSKLFKISGMVSIQWQIRL